MLKNNLYNNFVFFSLVINCCILLIPSNYKIYPIVLLLLSSAIFYKRQEFKNKFDFKKVLFLGALPLLYFASMFQSLYVEVAFAKLTTMLSLLAYPIIFGLLEASGFKLEQKKINALFTTFVLSTVTFFIVSFIYFWRQEFTFHQTIIHYFNLIDIRLGKFSIHAIYFAIYIGVSILMTVELIKNNTSLFYKIIFFLLAVFLSIVLVILMRKGPIIYLMIALFFLLKIHFNIKKTILLISTTIVFVFLFTTIAPKYQNINRFNELIGSDLNSKIKSKNGFKIIITVEPSGLPDE